MKVILLQDVARIGRRFEVTNVPDGHAINYLIPRKMAEPATRENVKRLENRRARTAADRESVAASFAETLAKLEGTTLKMPVEANEQGHLFKGLKADDIAALVTAEVGPLDPNQVSLGAPIKEVGAHTITIVCGDQTGSFTLEVAPR